MNVKQNPDTVKALTLARNIMLIAIPLAICLGSVLGAMTQLVDTKAAVPVIMNITIAMCAATIILLAMREKMVGWTLASMATTMTFIVSVAAGEGVAQTITWFIA